MEDDNIKDMRPSLHQTRLDLDKIGSPRQMGFRLMLCAFYLSVFELLKASIVEGVRNTIVKSADLSPAELRDLKRREDMINELLVEAGINPTASLYSNLSQQIKEYESSIGTSLKKRLRFGLSASLDWLHATDVLSEDELHLLTHIRKHRNEVAHELPNLVVGESFEVNIEYLEEMQRLLQKLDTYWFQLRIGEADDADELLDGKDPKEIDPYSLRMLVADKLLSAVQLCASELEDELGR